MGRKSSGKHQSVQPPASPTPPSSGSGKPLLIGLLIVAVLAVSAFAFWRGVEPAPAAAPTEAAASPATPPAPQAPVEPPAAAKLGPHPQANLPPLTFPAYAPPRPPEVIRAAYKFAAEHPEILSYVPCFCGCERTGHRGNEDCFVESRDDKGDVVTWNEHGMECAVCIDVATRSLQMFSAGASVGDIRAAIDREWSTRMPNHTPTPHPPAHNH